MGVARLLDHGLGNGIVKAEVEDGIHHARHGGTGTRTNTHQKGVLGGTELAVHEGFDVLDSSHDVIVKDGHDFLLTYLVVFVADVGSDGEPRGDRYADEVHFGQVGTLAAQLFAHLRISFGLTVSEEIDSFFVHNNVN